jgi:hypothetical protein
VSRAPSQTLPSAGPGEDTVKAFIAGLRDAPHGEHVIFGMVKPADSDDGLMVAHPGDCTTWVYLPASAIHIIKAGGEARCKDHVHPTAMIQLKAPQTDLEQAFAGVASLRKNRLNQLISVAQTSPCNPPCGQGEHCVVDPVQGPICQPGP